ncbi:MAG TPA: acylphosphatase [Gemmatimonadota bacterium]|nr:acylphosphatase [Gemmatimonadota bacterium]
MSSAQESCKAFKVHGRVQGVGFRWWALHRARDLELRGSVRNCVDGTVEIAFAGAARAVAQMCALLESGPRSASVEHLEELPTPEQFPEDFRIDY